MSQNPIYMHVNYLERIYPVERLIELAAEAGYDGVELRGTRVIKDGLEEYLDRTYKKAAECGIGITYGCGNEFYGGGAQAEKAMEDCRTLIAFAGKKGIKVLNAFGDVTVKEGCEYYDFGENGSGAATGDQWNQTVDYLRQAAEFAGEHGVLLCLEIHNCFIHDLAKPAMELLEKVGHKNLRVNFDYGNIFLNPNNQGMDEETSQLADKISYVHLKNMRSLSPFGVQAFWGTPLAQGDIDNFQLLRKLKSAGYEGIITLENVMRGDRRPSLHEDLAYVKNILGTIKSEQNH
jgi:sugar phosphate isomerase/epimerase